MKHRRKEKVYIVIWMAGDMIYLDSEDKKMVRFGSTHVTR